MPHIDELTLMMYIDQELPEEDISDVEAHLSHCPHCRQRHAEMSGEQQILLRTFADAASPDQTPQLNPFTEAQMQAIASLHKQYRLHSAWRTAAWAAALLTATGGYLLFLSSVWYEWLGQAWSSWKYDLFWTSAFWLKQSAEEFFLRGETRVVSLVLPFFVLFGMLLLVNARSSLLPQGKPSEGGRER
jgi:hypothetical protein